MILLIIIQYLNNWWRHRLTSGAGSRELPTRESSFRALHQILRILDRSRSDFFRTEHAGDFFTAPIQ